MKTKQFVTGLGLTAAAVTGTSVAADEVVPTSATETQQEQVNPVTEQEVTAAKAALDQADAAVDKQAALVASHQADKLSADQALNTAQTELASIEEITKEATPEGIKVAETNVTEAEKALSTAQTDLSSATQVKEEVSQAVANQEAVLKASQKTLATTETAVTTAQEQVNQAQAILAATNQADLIKAADDAAAKVDAAKNTLAQAEQALETAQVTDAARAQAISQTQEQLTTAQNDQAAAQVAADQAIQTATQTAQALLDAQNALAKLENDRNAVNIITLTTEYIRDLKEYTDKGKANQDRTEVMARLKAMAADLKKANTYKANPNDDKTTTYPINEIPTEVLTEVSLFASDLINQVRMQVGAPALTVVTPSSVAFADEVTDYAVADKWDTWTKRAHNDAGITKAAQTYNLRFSADRVANYYENWAGSGYYATRQVSLAQLKAYAHDAITRFLFASDEWEHANSIAGLRYGATPSVQYFAIDMSNLGLYSGMHFLGIDDVYLTSQSTNFDRTPIANPTVAVTETDIARARENVTAAQTANQIAQADKTAKETALSTAKEAVTKAQTNLTNAQALPEQVGSAQEQLNQAKLNLTNAIIANTTAQGALQQLSTDVQIKQDNLKTAQNILAQKEQERQLAQSEVTAQEEKLAELRTALRTAENTVSQAESTISQAETNLGLATDYLNKLRQAPQLMANARQKVQEAQNLQTQAAQTLADNALILTSLTAQQEQANNHYTNLNTRYQEQLEKARQLKLKEQQEAILQAGQQPLPVLDGTGKLVGYTPAPKPVQQATKPAPTATVLATPATATAQATAAKKLPETGDKTSILPLLTGLLLTGTGVAAASRKKEDN